jgi:hypothetical protein
MTRHNVIYGNSMGNTVSLAARRPSCSAWPHRNKRQAADSGLRLLVQHLWAKTKAPGAQSETASLRGLVDRTRMRFMQSVAIGKPDADAAASYTNAVKQYRIAMFAELNPRDLRRSAGNRKPSQLAAWWRTQPAR